MSESEKERPSDKHAEPAPPVDVPDAVRERVRAQASPVRCPFCHDDVRVGEQRWVACAGCLARHHAGCWGEAKRCSACGDAACLAGGRSRGRGVVLSVAGVMIVLLLGVRAVVQREFAGMRRDLQELTSKPDVRDAAPAPYLGETPDVAALRVAAHGGDVAAAHDLAAALAEGKGVAPDPLEALRWYERAADRGDARAMRALAASHESGKLQPEGRVDAARAVFWYRRAVEVDYDRATALKLIQALGWSPEALEWVERLDREAPDPRLMLRAHLITSRAHGEGRAVEAGWTERALAFLRERAGGGDEAAGKMLYSVLKDGGYSVDIGGKHVSWVSEPRLAEALELLERRAGAGAVWAMRHLEDVHRYGSLGLPRDDPRAREWARKLAEQGDASAMVRLGSALALGPPEDYQEPVDWLRRALAAPDIATYDADSARARLARMLKERPDLRQPGDP